MKQGWEIKKLGDVCNIICGQDYKSVQDDNGKYPIYGTGGIMGYASQYRCPAHTVIIGRKVSINNPIYVETEFWNVDTAFGVVPNKEYILPKFFYLFCKDYDFTRHDVSVTIPSLRRTDILKIDVPVPPIAEQEKIVAELDCLSGIIEKKKQQLKELDALAQSIFYEMFGDPIENDKGWDVRKLKSVTSKIGSGATPKGGNQAYKDEGISLIRSLNVHNNHFVYKDLAHIDDLQAASLNNVVVQEKDVLLNITGASVARCCVVPNDVLPARVNQHVAIIRPDKNLDNMFLCFQFTTSSYQQELLSIGKSNGATREALTKAQLESLSIILPSLALQQDFASKIEAIEKQKELIKQSIQETETLFNSRMDYYFN